MLTLSSHQLPSYPIPLGPHPPLYSFLPPIPSLVQGSLIFALPNLTSIPRRRLMYGWLSTTILIAVDCLPPRSRAIMLRQTKYDPPFLLVNLFSMCVLLGMHDLPWLWMPPVSYIFLFFTHFPTHTPYTIAPHGTLFRPHRCMS